MRLDRPQQFGAIEWRLADARLIDHAVQGIEQEYRRKAGIVDRPGISGCSGGEQFAQMVDQNVVRRLTPIECERLQSFPDGWTAVNGQADSTRYKQLGNAVCANVAEWLGNRIVATELKHLMLGKDQE